MPGVGSLFYYQYKGIMGWRDRPQKASFEQSGDYWFKSLLGFCGQGMLSLGYNLRGILQKNLYGEMVLSYWWGFEVPNLMINWGKTKGQVLGVRAGQVLWGHLMWRTDVGSKSGSFIEVCSLARRSHPMNAIGYWGTTIKKCVSIVLPKEQRREGVILG